MLIKDLLKKIGIFYDYIGIFFVNKIEVTKFVIYSLVPSNIFEIFTSLIIEYICIGLFHSREEV